MLDSRDATLTLARRALFGALTLILVLAVAPPVQAADPENGTVKNGNRTTTWTGGPYTVGVPNQLGCLGPDDPVCDAFALEVDTKAGRSFLVGITSAIETDDYDLYVYYPDGTEAGRSANAGSDEAVVIEHTLAHGEGPYQVRVLPFDVAQGSSYDGVARTTREAAIETPDDLTNCLAPVPDAIGLPPILDLGQIVSLDVAVLLDGVDAGLGNLIMTRAAESYAPLGVTLNVTEYESVSFQGTEGDALIQQAKDYYGGSRPAGSDLVYVLSSKDLTSAGDTGLAGLADCIGGVRFDDRAFAVGEAVGIDELAIGPFLLEVDAHPEIAAHELGHLMGAHHHYANCVEGVLQGEANDLSPCSLMFNFVDFQSLNFALVNTTVVRGHAVEFASP
jgi:hypothetical protein